MQNRIFTFANGYTIAIAPSYSPALIDALVRGWAEENPQPEPPTKQVKVKGGFADRPNPFDPEYLQDRDVWIQMQNDYRNEIVLQLAFDRDSIDKDLVAQARAKFAEFGGSSTKDDVALYIEIVADNGHGDPGDPDYRPNEIAELMRFAAGEKGPSGALVEHLLKTTFQNDLAAQTKRRVSGHLASSAQTEGQTQADPA